MGEILTQAYRGYAAISLLVVGFTGLWSLGTFDVSLPVLGYVWLLVAAFGGIVAVGLLTKKEDTIMAKATEKQVELFEESAVTGRPLEIYIVAITVWAAVSLGWILGGMSVEGPTIAIGGISTTGPYIISYGWSAIAFYGLTVGFSIAMNHRKYLAQAIKLA